MICDGQPKQNQKNLENSYFHKAALESQIFWLKHCAYKYNKKALLRERKRHTARRVASARYADLSGGGIPHPMSGGVPCPRLGGTPSQVGRVPNPFWLKHCTYKYNKKVLLRERKRHTARRVASARYADLSRGGYPVPCQVGGGTPSHVWGGTLSQVGGDPIPGQGGYPIPCAGGYPISGPGGVPRVPPHTI